MYHEKLLVCVMMCSRCFASAGRGGANAEGAGAVRLGWWFRDGGQVVVRMHASCSLLKGYVKVYFLRSIDPSEEV